MNDSDGRSSPQPPGDDEAADTLRRRLDLLEEENARLKRRLGAVGIADAPNFDPQAFQNAMVWYSRWMILPSLLMVPLFFLLRRGWIVVPAGSIGPVPLVDLGQGGLHPGMGFGLLAFGGLAVGGIAVGGLAVGIFAFGGGAIGVVAVGGGACGIFAFGGGAAGVFAIGGGACGRYVLGGSGAGKYVFTMKRQDREAVEFWVRYLPRFRAAVTTPLPAIPVDDGAPFTPHDHTEPP
ncbi:MAG: hypothetical protein ACE5E1_04315 [Phycisphaerae bacterium]